MQGQRGLQVFHAIFWDRVWNNKEDGGLGIRFFKEMNLALLAKRGWRYGTDKTSLWRRGIESKYPSADADDFLGSQGALMHQCMEIPCKLLQHFFLKASSIIQSWSREKTSQTSAPAHMEDHASSGLVGDMARAQQYIDSSGLGEQIPPELGNLKFLKTLWASDNRFTGKLPDFIGTLTDLTDLRLQGTLLEGPIPNSFGSLTKLQDLRLGDLTKEDSTLSFLENLTSLSILSLRNSRVSGTLPDKLGEFSKLKYLDLSFNKLTGQIPNSFQDFESLEILYLGNNHLTGVLPSNIITTKLVALDVSFNPISGNFPVNYGQVGLAMNFVGTSMNADSLYDRKVLGMLHCLQEGFACTKNVPSYSSFSINCGGREQRSISGTNFDDDSEELGAASLYTNSDDYSWAVSNTGIFISNPNGPQYMVDTDSQILGTLESELYKTARISPSSLRYYGLGLKNGKYSVELHFAEIALEDFHSWKGLGRRLFDIYIQGERVVQDFNIRNEAGGSKQALIKTFETNVTNTIVDIHLFWAGRGTCCIPSQGIYGPLVSAIHVYQGTGDIHSSQRDEKRVGKLLGIGIGFACVVFIMSSIFYLWWTKDSPGHMLVHTDSPKKG